MSDQQAQELTPAERERLAFIERQAAGGIAASEGAEAAIRARMSDQQAADRYIARLERMVAGQPIRNLDRAASAFRELDEAASAYYASLAARSPFRLHVTLDECEEAIRAKARASCNPRYKAKLDAFLAALDSLRAARHEEMDG